MAGEGLLSGVQTAISSLYSHMAERKVTFLVFVLLRALIPLVRAPTV